MDFYCYVTKLDGPEVNYWIQFLSCESNTVMFHIKDWLDDNCLTTYHGYDRVFYIRISEKMMVDFKLRFM